MRSLVIALFCLFCCFAFAAPSQSIGTYWNGKLKNAVEARSEFKKNSDIIESLSPKAYQYGSQAIVDSTLSIAKWLHGQWNGKHRLQVGDLSHENGGKIAHHETHQNGLDADIAFLSKNPKKEGHRWKAAHNKFRESFVFKKKLSEDFDIQKNYDLIQHVVNSQPVSQIFIACEVKDAFRALNPSDEFIAKLVGYPHHYDHFHLRLKCPDGNAECQNDPRVWKDVGCT